LGGPAANLTYLSRLASENSRYVDLAVTTHAIISTY
jgi:hypothetical protein